VKLRGELELVVAARGATERAGAARLHGQLPPFLDFHIHRVRLQLAVILVVVPLTLAVVCNLGSCLLTLACHSPPSDRGWIHLVPLVGGQGVGRLDGLIKVCTELGFSLVLCAGGGGDGHIGSGQFESGGAEDNRLGLLGISQVGPTECRSMGGESTVWAGATADVRSEDLASANSSTPTLGQQRRKRRSCWGRTDRLNQCHQRVKPAERESLDGGSGGWSALKMT
jgi:hypothetical protein